MIRTYPLVILVAALALAAGMAGYLADPLALAAALVMVLLAAIGLVQRPDGRIVRPHAVLSAVAIVMAIVLIATCPATRVNRLLAFAVLLLGLDAFARSVRSERREFLVAGATALVTGIWFALLRHLASQGFGWDRDSVALSSWVGRLVGKPLLLGPSYSGLDVIFLFAFAIFILAVVSGRRPFGRLFLSIVMLASAGVVYLSLMTLCPNYPEPGASWFAARCIPWNMPALLIVLCLPALAFMAWRLKPRLVDAPATRLPRVRAALAAVAFVAAATVVVMHFPEKATVLRADGRAKRVVLRGEGYLNWQSPAYQHLRDDVAVAIASSVLTLGAPAPAGVATFGGSAMSLEQLHRVGATIPWPPDEQAFGQYSSGMLGRLPVFLRLLGFDARLSGELTAGALADADVAVLLNPYAVMSDAELVAIWDFVRAGGSLLVVGEHTWLTPDRKDVLNTLLSPTDIRVNFDSATWHIGGWLYAYRDTGAGVYRLRSEHLNEPGFTIGASLSISGDAAPLLVATHGYSDAGIVRDDPEQANYYGDNRYLPGERLGDLVLAAEQRIGNGRVVVLGDTTPFINNLLVGSHEAVERVFARLVSPVDESGLRLARPIVFLLLVAAISLLPWSRPASVVPLLAAALACAVIVPLIETRAASAFELQPTGDVAYVDGSHSEVYSRDSWREDGLAGLHLNLMRSGLQPLRMDRFDRERLGRARMFFIIAPRRTFSGSEVDAIEWYIRGGGYVVVAAGADSADALAPLLERFGLVIRNRPLGPFITKLETFEGDVQLRVGYAVENSQGGGEVWAWSWFGKPRTTAVMIEKRSGTDGPETGGLLLIGDGQFFMNKNLEPDKQPPLLKNVAFLRRLVEHVRDLQAARGEP